MTRDEILSAIRDILREAGPVGSRTLTPGQIADLDSLVADLKTAQI